MQEMYHIRSLGIKTPIAVIPNALEISKPTSSITNKKGAIKRIGFIGRFAPIKNMEILIKAWSITCKNKSDWELVLIGDGSSDYKHSLFKLVSDLDIKNILFPGFLTGNAKEEMLNSLSYLVLPSKSENFGMVVPEALIKEIPVIASTGTPWEELNVHNAGWWIEIGVETLALTLQEAINLSDTERIQMGRNGRKLVEEYYSIETVAKKMMQLYAWILKESTKPEFVY
jgi:glycosyltransferase involved in cell wall biosynthesis